MKKSILLLLAAFATLAASAQTKVEIDGIWYNLVSKAKQAEVTYKGSSYDEYRNVYSGSINIPATVSHEGVDYSVTSIGEWAFFYCSDLTSITIPEGVTSIGTSAFWVCNSLTDINIPEGVTSIGSSAFQSCSSLMSINIPETVTSIGGYAFSGCSSLTNINIPEGVTYIGYGVFKDCSSLMSITIPKRVTGFDTYAFSGCSSLTSITIPEGVTFVGTQAFQNCKSLISIELPKSINHINSEAFANCSELLDVYCSAETVPWTEADAFDGSYPEYATLHVPAVALNAYKSTAPWSSFGTIKTIENVTLEKCATPTISYENGEVVFTCETEGAVIKSEVKEDASGKFEETRIALIPTYTITAYATKEHYENSDEVTLTLCWIPCCEEHEDEETGILTIPSKPVLIGTQGGTITVSGLAAGTAVVVTTTAGTPLATATATDGTVTLATNLTQGNIAIVKMGDYSVKVAIK